MFIFYINLIFFFLLLFFFIVAESELAAATWWDDMSLLLGIGMLRMLCLRPYVLCAEMRWAIDDDSIDSSSFNHSISWCDIKWQYSQSWIIMWSNRDPYINVTQLVDWLDRLKYCFKNDYRDFHLLQGSSTESRRIIREFICTLFCQRNKSRDKIRCCAHRQIQQHVKAPYPFLSLLQHPSITLLVIPQPR